MNNALQKYLEAASGLTNVTAAKAEKIVKGLVRSGEAAADQVTDLAEDLVDRSAKNREAIVALVKSETTRAVRAMGLATTKEVDRLQKQVADLKQRLHKSQRGETATSASSGEGAPAKQATAKKATGKKATAKKATAKKAAGKKTTAKKATAKKAAGKKAAAKKATAKKAAGKKTAAKKTAAKTAPAKTAPAKQASAKKSAAKKATGKKAAGKKATAKKATAASDELRATPVVPEEALDRAAEEIREDPSTAALGGDTAAAEASPVLAEAIEQATSGGDGEDQSDRS